MSRMPRIGALISCVAGAFLIVAGGHLPGRAPGTLGPTHHRVRRRAKNFAATASRGPFTAWAQAMPWRGRRTMVRAWE